MKFLLTSAGFTNKSIADALKKLAGGEIKIAFIPTAANKEEDKSWLQKDLDNCRKLGEVDVVDISVLEKSIWLEKLKWANVILVGGGDTTYLMKWVIKSRLTEELPKLLKKRVYVGISAGSIILSKSIQASSEYLFSLYGDEVKNPPSGLGLINFDIRPHLNSPCFPKVNEKYLTKVFKNIDEDLYAIDDNSAVVFDDGKIEVVSEGKWIKYTKD